MKGVAREACSYNMKLGNHLSIYLKKIKPRKRMLRWPVAGPSIFLPMSSQQPGIRTSLNTRHVQSQGHGNGLPRSRPTVLELQPMGLFLLQLVLYTFPPSLHSSCYQNMGCACFGQIFARHHGFYFCKDPTRTSVPISTLFNILKPGGNYMSHLLQQSVTLYFCTYGFGMMLTINSDYFLKQH
jgi:hypothetical protein